MKFRKKTLPFGHKFERFQFRILSSPYYGKMFPLRDFPTIYKMTLVKYIKLKKGQ